MGQSVEEVIRRSRWALREACDHREVVATLAPLRGRKSTQVAVALFEFMVEFPDWSPLIADEIERLIELHPEFATKQRLFFGYSRDEALAVLNRQGHRWAVAALLTLHHDGFVREAAVGEAARHLRAVRFIVNRYSDWVPNVAAAARRAVPRERAPADPGMWRWAIESARRIRGEGGEALTRLLHDPEARKAAMRDPVAARFVLDSVSELQPDDPLVEAGLSSPHSVVRFAIALRLQLDAGSLPLAEELLRDPMPAIRIAALQMLGRLQPDHPSIGKARLDKNFRVRSQARLQSGGRDAALPFYRASLPHPSAIEGIGETGKQADVETITPYLTDGDPRKRKAALRALATLNTPTAVPQIKALLTDPSGHVVREAIRALHSLRATIDREEIESILPPRVALFATANLMPRWQAGTFLLRYATTLELQEEAAMRLRNWAYRVRFRAHPPRREDLEAFTRARTAEWLPSDLRETLQELEDRWR